MNKGSRIRPANGNAHPPSTFGSRVGGGGGVGTGNNKPFNAATIKNQKGILKNTRPSPAATTRQNTTNNSNNFETAKRSRSAEVRSATVRPSRKTPTQLSSDNCFNENNNNNNINNSENDCEGEELETIEVLLNNKSFENLDSHSFARLFEIFSSTPNKSGFLKKLFALLETSESTSKIESKLQSMKNDIDKLRAKLGEYNSTTKRRILGGGSGVNVISGGNNNNNNNWSSCGGGVAADPACSPFNMSTDARQISKDLKTNLNTIVSNYTRQLSDIRQQIFELKDGDNGDNGDNGDDNEDDETLAATATTEQTLQSNIIIGKQKRADDDSERLIANKSSGQLSIQFMQRLQDDLNKSTKKCDELKRALTNKTRENENYALLFRYRTYALLYSRYIYMYTSFFFVYLQFRCVCARLCLFSETCATINALAAQLEENERRRVSSSAKCSMLGVRPSDSMSLTQNNGTLGGQSASEEVRCLLSLKEKIMSFHQAAIVRSDGTPVAAVLTQDQPPQQQQQQQQHNRVKYDANNNMKTSNETAGDECSSSSTSSNTLIDADFSFDANVYRDASGKTKKLNKKQHQQHQQQAQQQQQRCATSCHNAYCNMVAFHSHNESSATATSTTTTTKRASFEQHETCVDDEEQEEASIMFKMDELSITTLQTSQLSKLSETRAPSTYSYGNDDSAASAYDTSFTSSVSSSSISKPQDSDQFQEGLKKLDQKIFKVKQLLESMKNS